MSHCTHTTPRFITRLSCAVIVAAMVVPGCNISPTTAPQVPRSATPSKMRALVPGDVFEVRVFGEEDLSGEFQVQDDGSINFPLLGKVAVSGRTQAELAQTLESGLADGYLRAAHVTVVVKERQNLEVSVLGEVNTPGSFSWVDRMTLVQAVSNAGGLGQLAAGRRLRLTRHTANGPQTFEISLDAITAGEAEDLFLEP